jgi:hypothetical protein
MLLISGIVGLRFEQSLISSMAEAAEAATVEEAGVAAASICCRDIDDGGGGGDDKDAIVKHLAERFLE